MGPAGQREKRGREARLGWGDTGPRRELGRARGEREVLGLRARMSGGRGERFCCFFFSIFLSFIPKPFQVPFKKISFEILLNFTQSYTVQKYKCSSMSAHTCY